LLFLHPFLRAIYLAKFIKMWLPFTVSIQKWKKYNLFFFDDESFKSKTQIKFVQKWK
jgi:hypothetical protein